MNAMHVATVVFQNIHNRRKMQKIFLLFAGIGISCSVLAQQTQTLDEVQIRDTSVRSKSQLYQPASITKVSTIEIKRSTGLFLDDAINTNVPGVFMQRRTVGGGQSFNIRGYGNGARGTNGINSNFDGQGYKVYLNNIPITDAEGITVMDDIDFGSIGSVEVIKGPAGTLYGQAIAGAVNLTTIKPANGKRSIGQEVLVGSYGLQRYTTTLQVGGERSSLLVNYGKQLFDGFMVHTASHKDFVNVYGEVRPNAKQNIGVYVGYSNSYDERNGELDTVQYRTKNYTGNPNYIKNNAHSNVISFRAGLTHTYQFLENISNTTTVFGSSVSSNASSAGGWTDKTPLNYGLRSTLDMSFNLGQKFKLSGITGIEAQRQNAQTIGYGMVADSFNLSGYNIIGAMRSNQYTISSTWSAFTEWTLAMPYSFFLTAGLGYSKMNIELNDRFYVATNNNPSNPKGTHNPAQYRNSYDNMLSPRFALNKVFNQKLSVYASYSQGYKAPVSAYFFIPTTGQVNTNLKPEKGTQIEIGSKGVLLNDRLRYELAVFQAKFTDKMTVVAVPNPANTATLYTYMVNGGTMDNKGLELAVKYSAYRSAGFLSEVIPFANFTYSDFKYKDFIFQQSVKNAGKDSVVSSDYSNKIVAGVPKVVANAGVDVFTKIGLYGNVTYSYRDAMYFTSLNVESAKTDAYGLLNAKLGYRVSFLKRFDADVYFGANNITGTQYYQAVFVNQLPDAYLPGPAEINYFGGLSLKFNF